MESLGRVSVLESGEVPAYGRFRIQCMCGRDLSSLESVLEIIFKTNIVPKVSTSTDHKQGEARALGT